MDYNGFLSQNQSIILDYLGKKFFDFSAKNNGF